MRSHHHMFMKRTANIFRHQQNRARSCHQHMDYNLDQFRAWVRKTLGSQCDYCHQVLTAANFSVDHHEPIRRGGTFLAENLNLVCMRCNKLKGILTALEYQSLLDLIKTWPAEVKKNLLTRLYSGGKYMRG